MARIEMITRELKAPAVAVDKARRTVRAIVNSEDIDGHGTVISPAGMDLEVFRRNPVVLVNHGQDARYGTIPVGLATDIRLVEYPSGSRRRAIEATVRFREDDDSDRVWRAYADRTMRGFSVNVLPREASPPTREEIRSRPEMARCSMVFRETELRELSAVSVPSNPAALALEVMRHASGGNSLASRIALYRHWARNPVMWGRLATELGRLEAEQRRSGVRLRGRKDLEGLSVEELRAEIERLRLMAELEELLGKHHQAMAHEAAAAERDKALAEFAAGAGKRS